MIFKKVCILGDFAVGKTSLVRRFVDRQFSDEYLSTVGVKISRKLMNVGVEESTQLQLILWDIEGHSVLRATSPDHLRGAHGAIIVGDLCRKASLESMPHHAETFLSFNPGAAIVYAKNKSDLATGIDDGSVRLENFPSYTTSAKTGALVDKVFRELGTILLNETSA